MSTEKTWARYDEGRELLQCAGVPESEWTPHAVEVAGFFAKMIHEAVIKRVVERLAEQIMAGEI